MENDGKVQKKVAPGLGTLNAYEVHGKQTYSNA